MSAEQYVNTKQSIAPSAGYGVAIVGATGVVGYELIKVLERRKFPIDRLRLIASPRSVGRTICFDGEMHHIEAIGASAFHDSDFVFFSAGSSTSRAYSAAARDAGAIVIDNSSAYRMDPDVPLVVPEVNGSLLDSTTRLIANPNCVAAIASIALAPFKKLSKIQRLSISTYQSASGAGAAAMQELLDATKAYNEGVEFIPKILPHPYAFNLFSHNAEVDLDSGYNGEELKVIAELRRILDCPELAIGVTCVRVPVLRAHSMAINIELSDRKELNDVLDALTHADGVRVVDDKKANYFPMPSDASGGDPVLVGRLRYDLSDSSQRTISIFVCGDQLLKGAALNAVQIAEALLKIRDQGSAL